jgi:hypothetical protein
MKNFSITIIDFDEGIYSDNVIVKNVVDLTAEGIETVHTRCTKVIINNSIFITIPGEFVEYKELKDEK